jgi:hypothetical protein
MPLIHSRWLPPALFVLYWLGLSVAAGDRFLRDPGTFWHVATGEKLLRGDFMNTDPYTFTHAGEWWIPYQWLGEVVMAAAHRVGGFDAVLSLAVVTVAGLFAWLTTRTLRTGLHPVFGVAVVMLALAAAASHFHARPLLFSTVSMAVTMYAICMYDAGKIGLRQLAILIPLYAVWTNFHGGMLGGLTTMGLAGIGWAVWAAAGKHSPITGLRAALGLGIVGVCCGLTAFATPYGTDLAKTWMLIMNMPHLPDLIQEHARMELTDRRNWPMLALGCIYLFALGGTLKTGVRVAWLVPLFWLAQAFLRVRHGSLFAVVATVALIDMWPHTRWAAWLATHRPDAYVPPTKPDRGSVVGILLAAVVAVAVSWTLQAKQVEVPGVGYGSAKFDAKAWPFDLLDVIREHEPKSPGETVNVFNGYSDGGFFIYYAPNYRVFVDDRCEVFGDDWLVEFVLADEDGTAEAMAAWQARYPQWDYALTRHDTGFDEYYRTRPTEWRLLKKGTVGSFYKRVKGK